MYRNWEEQDLNSLTTIKWYPIAKVISYLDNLRQFIIRSPGVPNESNMPMLHRGTEYDLHYQSLPARKNERFPVDEAYICEAIGDWGLKLDNLALISSVMINTNRLKRKYPKIDSPGDLEHLALEKVHEIRRMVQGKVDFVNRQIFEALYTLDWTDEDAHIISQESTIPANGHSTNNERIENNSCDDGELDQNRSLRSTASSNEREHWSPNNVSDHTIDLTTDGSY
ncbi:hypothetical protein [Parasitella parasitica]|uniref:Uncharacterized protein n=1 Tax=Parasitella parasitica TaxID=35722 RepID=A0A0B7NB57_9FUNG|nr:hypothetical protein [Parasitella parasitica]